MNSPTQLIGCARCWFANHPGCPRRYFFPCLFVFYGLFTVLFPMQAAAAYTWGNFFAKDIVCQLVQALGIIPMPLMSTLGGKLGQMASELTDVEPTSGHVILLPACVLMLSLCWLRLRHAGKSPLYLFIGTVPSLVLLTWLLLPHCDGDGATVIALVSLLLYYLSLTFGSLWLLILYCLPGRKP